MIDEIKNRVANSNLITVDLEDFYPKGKRLEVDISMFLFQGLLLREREFRAKINKHDWSQYQHSYIALTNKNQALVPAWAFMLIASAVSPFAKNVVKGSLKDLNKHLFSLALQNIDLSELQDKFVIVKGCSNLPVPESTYVELCNLLQPLVKTLSYGEACSKVPLYKKR